MSTRQTGNNPSNVAAAMTKVSHFPTKATLNFSLSSSQKQLSSRTEAAGGLTGRRNRDPLPQHTMQQHWSGASAPRRNKTFTYLYDNRRVRSAAWQRGRGQEQWPAVARRQRQPRCNLLRQTGGGRHTSLCTRRFRVRRLHNGAVNNKVQTTAYCERDLWSGY